MSLRISDPSSRKFRANKKQSAERVTPLVSTKGGRQKGIGKKSDQTVKKVTKGYQNVTETDKKVTYPFCVPPFLCGTLRGLF